MGNAVRTRGKPMTHTIHFVRKWNPAKDCIAHDERGNKKDRGIYTHTWPTGSQELVFDSLAEARSFEQLLNRPELENTTMNTEEKT
jgi:hypothetical protein